MTNPIEPKEECSTVSELDLFNILEPTDFSWLFQSVGGVASLPYGLLFLLVFSSLIVYGIIVARWSSSSKYAFLGSLRSAAQMISYKVSVSLVVVTVVLLS